MTDLDQVGSSEGDKGYDSECILKVALARFASGWPAGRDTSCKMRRCLWCTLRAHKGHGDPLLHTHPSCARIPSWLYPFSIRLKEKEKLQDIHSTQTFFIFCFCSVNQFV